MNTKPKFTAGPWEIMPGDYSPVITDESGKILAKVYFSAETGNDKAEEENTANSALISAAPDMYAALVALVNCPDYKGISTHEMKSAKAAIQKAEGK